MVVEGNKLSIMLLASDLVALTELNQHCLFVVRTLQLQGNPTLIGFSHSLSCLGQGKPSDAGTSYFD